MIPQTEVVSHSFFLQFSFPDLPSAQGHLAVCQLCNLPSLSVIFWGFSFNFQLINPFFDT